MPRTPPKMKDTKDFSEIETSLSVTARGEASCAGQTPAGRVRSRLVSVTVKSGLDCSLEWRLLFRDTRGPQQAASLGPSAVGC